MTEQGEIFAPMRGEVSHEKNRRCRKNEKPENYGISGAGCKRVPVAFLENIERGEKGWGTKSALCKRSPVWAGLPKLGEA